MDQREGEAAGIQDDWDCRHARLLAGLGHMNWAISKVFRGKMNPANELRVHSKCARPGSKVEMFSSRDPHEWEVSILNVVFLLVWKDSEVD